LVERARFSCAREAACGSPLPVPLAENANAGRGQLPPLFSNAWFGGVQPPKKLEPLGKEAIDQFVSLIPRGTMGRPEEIATAALFLASSDSSFVAGVELFVDGGTAQI
jgi:NAD(P)-dependent dehydrogenase (short-subunit alcohol dehydrogenase family)